MKRLAVITVGKTHSGKSTFAKKLENKLLNSIIIDQDNHAEFLTAHYRKLQPQTGQNLLKNSLTQFIADYIKQQTNFHIIVSNANRSIDGREYLLKEVYPPTEFLRILVHFNIPDDILLERVQISERSTAIVRSASTFEEVLIRQQKESRLGNVKNPSPGEADYLFVIKRPEDAASVVQEIIQLVD